MTGSYAPAAPDVEGHSMAVIRIAGSSAIRGLLGTAFIVVVGVAGLSSVAQPDPRTSTARSIVTTPVTPAIDRGVAAATPDRPNSDLNSNPNQNPRPTPAHTPGGGPAEQGDTATVLRVVDAVTIVVAIGGRQYEVRYAGLGAAGSLPRQAAAANRALVVGKAVVLETDVTQADSEGRLLRHVWVKRGSRMILVNLELVRRGLARVATDSGDKKHAVAYLAAQRHARAGHLGLWATPAISKPKPNASSKPPKPSTPPNSRPDSSDHGRP